MIITNGKIEYADNMYVLKIENAQGQPFPFSNQAEQIKALKDLTKYADENKINIVNKNEFPTTANNIEPVNEDKPVNESVVGEKTNIGSQLFKQVDFAEFVKDAEKMQAPDIKSYMSDKDMEFIFSKYEPSKPFVGSLVPKSAADVFSNWNKTTTVFKETGKDLDKVVEPKAPVNESFNSNVYTKIYESNSFELKPEVKVFADQLSQVFSARISPLKKAGYSIDEIKDMVNEAINISFEEL